MHADFKLLPAELLPAYSAAVADMPLHNVDALVESELTTATFSFHTSASAVYSSRIEGEDIELDAYVKYKRFDIAFLPDYTQRADDLYEAYQFAKTNKCDRTNLLAAHAMLTAHILAPGKGGRLRTSMMYVSTPEGRIAYVAVPPQHMQEELEKFFEDLDTLQRAELTRAEAFFFAAVLHLVLVNIHPFDDGNGRCARLMEKWFLASKLGEKAWLIPSERNYFSHLQAYYRNLALLGLEYETLDYGRSLPFLLMLPASLTMNTQER